MSMRNTPSIFKITNSRSGFAYFHRVLPLWTGTSRAENNRRVRKIELKVDRERLPEMEEAPEMKVLTGRVAPHLTGTRGVAAVI